MSELSLHPDHDGIKTRRLVPQHSLTKQDLGADSSVRVRQVDTPKKPVIRFTRESLISLRKESPILPSMLSFTDINSIETLNPVCFTRLEPEDVTRLYSVGIKETHGRGRARGLKYVKAEDAEKIGEDSKNSDLWDDNGASSNEQFDLADFAKAALKFRTDMEDMKQPLVDSSSSQQDGISSLLEASDVSELSKADTSTLASDSALNILLDTGRPMTDFSSSLSTSLLPSTGLDGGLFGSSLNFGSTFSNFFSKKEQMEYEWFYTDPNGNIQGPFQQETMRLWNEEGYFTLDLPIKMSNWQKFHLFKEVFSNHLLAFVDIPVEPVPVYTFPEPSSSLPPLVASPIPAVIENESELKQSFAPDLNENQPFPAPVANAIDREFELPKTDSVVSHNVEKSDFAKKLLGIGRNTSIESAPPMRKSPAVDTSTKTKLTEPQLISTSDRIQMDPTSEITEVVEAITTKPPAKGWSQPARSVVRLTDIQHEQKHEEISKPKVDLTKTSSQPGLMSIQLKSLLGLKSGEDSKPKQAWSTTSETPTTSSLREIMDEERRSAVKESLVGTPSVISSKPVSATSWAAKAKIGATVDSSPTPSTIVHSWEKSTAAAIVEPVVHPTELSSVKSNRSNFRRKLLSKDLADWSEVQLIKILGTDTAVERIDGAMEVVEFCMTLKSQGEIRSYLSQHLGSSPEVTRFATDFIKFKEKNIATSLPEPAVHHTGIHSAKSNKSDFGGKLLTKELADWCAVQLIKIQGTDDAMELMEFCMSLKSSVEIRTYLSQYLGSSPQVTNFATDFIKFKEGGKKMVSVDKSSEAKFQQVALKKKKSIGK